MIYIDNSATSFFKPEAVIESVCNYLRNPGNPGRGVNNASLSASSIVFDTRMKLATFFGMDDFTKVVFTSGITESSNIIINGIVKQEDHIITTYLEHNSTLRPLYKKGCDITFTDGTLDEIKQSVKKNTKAVIINHCSNVTGEIQDIKSIGKWCKENGLLFIIDTAQSAGIISINIKECNVDILCFTGHKGLMGMQGIGGIVVNTDTYIEPLKYGGTGVHSFDEGQPNEYPTHLEAGTQNVPGIVSLNASIDYINDFGIDKIYSHEMGLKKNFLDYLMTRKDIDIYKNDNKESTGVVSFNIRNVDAAMVSDYLSTKYDICIRVGAHCAPLVLKHYGITSSARVSFGLNNKQSDVDVLIDAIEHIKG